MDEEHDEIGIVPPYIRDRITQKGIDPYYVTIGVKYGRREGDEEHPLGMFADEYAVIEAPDIAHARAMAHAVFGTQYAFLYDHEDFILDGTAQRWHEGGEVLRIKWIRKS